MCVKMAKVVEYSHVLSKMTFKLQVMFDKNLELLIHLSLILFPQSSLRWTNPNNFISNLKFATSSS
jgi:hypothetical protein